MTEMICSICGERMAWCPKCNWQTCSCYGCQCKNTQNNFTKDLNERQLLLSKYSTLAFHNAIIEMTVLFKSFNYGDDWFEILEQLIAEKLIKNK